MQPSPSMRAGIPAVLAMSKAGWSSRRSDWGRPRTAWARSRRHAGPVCSYRQPGEPRLEARGELASWSSAP